jgi:hypothetical protein
MMQALNVVAVVVVVDIDSSRKLRESFAKACFETLLQFSFSTQGGSTDSGVITQLAVKSLLDRCQSVLVTFVADDRLSGKCPLPRYSVIYSLYTHGTWYLIRLWCNQILFAEFFDYSLFTDA